MARVKDIQKSRKGKMLKMFSLFSSFLLSLERGRRHHLDGDSNPNQIVSAFVFGGVLDPSSLRHRQEAKSAVFLLPSLIKVN
jgi:hypothetical protein